MSRFRRRGLAAASRVSYMAARRLPGGSRRRVAWLNDRFLLAVARSAAVASRSRSGRCGVVLLYHRITDASPIRPSLVPTVGASDFERQLEVLAGSYWVVPLDDLVAAVEQRRPGDPVPLAITFDDDLPEHLRVAAPRLEAAGLTATFFLCGASLREPHRFWWEALEEAAGLGVELPALLHGDLEISAHASLEEVAERIKSASSSARARVEARLAAALAEPQHEVLDAPQTGALARRFTIGFHTRWHPFLPSLDDAELQAALREGRAELEAVTGAPLRAIAYPHGGIDARVPGAARDAGFALGVTTDSRRVGADAMRIGRVEPGAVAVGRFQIEIERALAG